MYITKQNIHTHIKRTNNTTKINTKQREDKQHKQPNDTQSNNNTQHNT